MPPRLEMLAVIDAPHFYAGIVLLDAVVTHEVAPIVKYMRYWSRQKVRDYCQRNGWKVSVVYEGEA